MCRLLLVSLIVILGDVLTGTATAQTVETKNLPSSDKFLDAYTAGRAQVLNPALAAYIDSFLPSTKSASCCDCPSCCIDDCYDRLRGCDGGCGTKTDPKEYGDCRVGCHDNWMQCTSGVDYKISTGCKCDACFDTMID